MAFNEGINTCSTDILTMSLMINIQRGKEFNDEAEVLDWFSENGFGISDEHLTHNSGGRIGYAVYESVNSTIFTEDNDVGLFTEHIIEYIRTLTEFDTITVKEDAEDTDFVFLGTAIEFLTYWDSMGEEQQIQISVSQ